MATTNNVHPLESRYVGNASNPHPQFGYFHGPYDATCIQTIQQDQGQPPISGLLISSHGSKVCGYTTEGVMCGQTFKGIISLRRHIKHQHHCPIPNHRRANATVQERSAARNALVKYARSMHWKNDHYSKEPKDPEVMLEICDDLEEYAASNAAFAQTYGTSFHRA